jgi:zeaxanthin glucosyltransferase
MHIALICPELPGHLNPMAALGRELARRGHRVSLVARLHAKPKADAYGFELIPVELGEHEIRKLQAGLHKITRLEGLRAVKLTAQLVRDRAVLTLRDGPERLRAAGVEAVVVDQVYVAGAALAESLRLPFVMAYNSLPIHPESGVPPWAFGWRYRTGPVGRLRNRIGNILFDLAHRPLVRTISEFRRRHGFPRFRLEDIGELGLAQIAHLPAFFDFPRAEMPAHFHYTGPWDEPTRDSESVPFPWEKLDGRPLVYASLGTISTNRQRVFRAILEGCAELPFQVVLSLGQKEATLDFPAPANAIVAPFAPQLTLLDRASLFITHAGLNSVLEGLNRGVPMLCIPVTYDHPGIARRVEWLGAGEVLKPGRANATRVRAFVEKLLAGKYREAAQKCREQLKKNPGVVRAADIVEEAFRTGRRVERRKYPQFQDFPTTGLEETWEPSFHVAMPGNNKK